MNKILLSFLTFLTAITVKATIHNVSIENMAFSPQTLSVEVGDTIRWTLVNGNHNVNSVALSLPAGAALISSGAMGSNMTIGSTYDYKVSIAGNYGYFCGIHSNMVGGFVATPSTASISKINKATELKAYPNPFKTKISIPNKNAESIEIFSVLGEKVKTVDVSSFDKTTTIDLSDLRKGVYFYALKDASGVLETRKIVKSE